MRELIAAAKTGDMAAGARLYSANAGLVFTLARRYAGMDPAVGMDDLQQTAFPALMEAARTFRPDAGMGWASWLALYVRKAMRQAVGLRGRRRAHTGALPLDAPLFENSDETRLDGLADPSTPESDAQLLEDERRSAVREAVSRLEDNRRAVIQAHDLEGRTYADIGAEMGVEPPAAARLRNAALCDLRRDWRLMRALDVDYYRGCGVGTFNTTWTSSTERAAIWRIEHGIG